MTPASAYAHALARTTVTSDDCWLWQGATCSKGYGHIKVGGRNVLLQGRGAQSPLSQGDTRKVTR